MVGLDVCFQLWNYSRANGWYRAADFLRDYAEEHYYLTFFASGDTLMETVNARRMNASVWHKKYGNPNVGEIIAATDSYIKSNGLKHGFNFTGTKM